MLTKEERKIRSIQFWTQFDDYCETLPELKGRKKKWILHDTKISHIDLKFDLSKNSAIVAIEINHKSEFRRLQAFEQLERYRSLLNEGFSTDLTWDFCYLNANDQEVCRIYIEKPDLDLYNTNDWKDIQQFLAANMLIAQNNFLEIQESLQEELNALLRDS
ncbi:MAG: DUF4268 domain-containing protein [Bacteroidia bacterium]|nr:DUF4268 domain-containing protein [Bacteroidia bacterium]